MATNPIPAGSAADVAVPGITADAETVADKTVDAVPTPEVPDVVPDEVPDPVEEASKEAGTTLASLAAAIATIEDTLGGVVSQITSNRDASASPKAPSAPSPVSPVESIEEVADEAMPWTHWGMRKK